MCSKQAQKGFNLGCVAASSCRKEAAQYGQLAVMASRPPASGASSVVVSLLIGREVAA